MLRALQIVSTPHTAIIASTVSVHRCLCLRPAEAEALGALRIISAALGKARLHHLNLSDNALGEKGIRACAEAFANQVGLGAAAVHLCQAVEGPLSPSSGEGSSRACPEGAVTRQAGDSTALPGAPGRLTPWRCTALPSRMPSSSRRQLVTVPLCARPAPCCSPRWRASPSRTSAAACMAAEPWMSCCRTLPASSEQCRGGGWGGGLLQNTASLR